MENRIRLNPYPGAPYFTVQEHFRSFSPKVHKNPDEYLDRAEKHLRSLFNISPGFRFYVYEKRELGNVLDQTEDFILKDDPTSGIGFKIENKHQKSQTILLDLSYSFPQVQQDFSNYNLILINPNASLGIPAGYIFVFSKKKPVGVNKVNADSGNPYFTRDIYIIHKVLEDYVEKGMEVLVRESNYKVAVLNQMIENSVHLNFVANKKNRSKTMITAECNLKFLEGIDNMGFEVGIQKTSQSLMITIANYATHSKELIEMFADRVATI